MKSFLIFVLLILVAVLLCFILVPAFNDWLRNAIPWIDNVVKK